MLEMGIVVGLGLLVTLVKLNWKWRMKMLSNPVAMDLIVFVLLCFLHWGTYSGVMVATVGALFCSIVLSIARKCIGYIGANGYVPGIWNVEDKLNGTPPQSR